MCAGPLGLAGSQSGGGEEGGGRRPEGLSALTLPPQSPQAGPSLCPEFPKTLAFCPSILGGVMG